jgi:hypothetical protein
MRKRNDRDTQTSSLISRRHAPPGCCGGYVASVEGSRRSGHRAVRDDRDIYATVPERRGSS